MHELERIVGRYPWAIVGLAGLVGWVLGAGILPFGIPGLSSTPTPAPAAVPASSAAAGAPRPSSSLATSSAAMAPAAAPVDDPFAGYGI